MKSVFSHYDYVLGTVNVIRSYPSMNFRKYKVVCHACPSKGQLYISSNGVHDVVLTATCNMNFPCLVVTPVNRGSNRTPRTPKIPPLNKDTPQIDLFRK